MSKNNLGEHELVTALELGLALAWVQRFHCAKYTFQVKSLPEAVKVICRRHYIADFVFKKTPP